MNLIFDFDGTIADSFQTVVRSFNSLATQYNLKPISDNEIAQLHNLSSEEIIKYFKIPLHQIPSIINQIRTALLAEMKTIPTFTNLPKVLELLFKSGFTLGIITSNSEENVRSWLEHHKLTSLFAFIHIVNDFFGKGHVLQKIIKRYGIDKTSAFYIGDETRDIEAAKDNEIYSVAVAWGFTAEQVLLKSEPHFIAHKPEDLLTMVSLPEFQNKSF